jgi:acyl carrier protein
MSIKQDIKTYILENYLFTDDDSQLSSSDSFLEKGILDSTGILEVIYFIEDEYGIRVEDDEIFPENLDSVESLVVFVKHKQGLEVS